jgi:hypothetical protein
MQNILARVINYWYDLNCRMLNGKTESYKRQKFLDEFRSQDGFNVIILSPVVAGVGITLTEANHVIHYTRLWNPAKEAQATDRVYRIGQQNEVFVTLNSNIGILIEKNNKFTVVVCSLNDHKAFKESDFSLFRGHKNILSVELNIRIDKILIITNRTTEQTIHATDFELFNKNDLHEMINGLNISYEDIEKENEQRYSIETLKRML